MAKPRILLQLDTDSQPSVFDSVVAVDAGVEHLLRHAGITAENVRERVHGAIFTRGPADLKNTAIFVGGSEASAAQEVFDAVTASFFGPMRVSVMLDPNGANTTAAAAVLAAQRHLPLAGATALVLAATGPVGERAVRLLARAGATIRAASRSRERALAVCRRVQSLVPETNVSAVDAQPGEQIKEALAGVQLVIAAGAAGVRLLSVEDRAQAGDLKVIIDLNAVPPLGVEGVEVMDQAADRAGVIAYGAIGVGGTKMKIHKRAIARLFESNDLLLDAEELMELGLGIG